jgi:aminoglycoside phosphotransferase (APT) family kinase protein
VSAPTPALAAQIVQHRLGHAPLEVRRFTTGIRHYVFECVFEDGSAVVARIGAPANRAEIEGGVRLSRRLRPLGVPLPELLADGSAEPYPHMLLERFPGTDLGAVAHRLTPPQLEAIAGRMVAAQAIVAAQPTAGRYGYAAEPRAAPFATWSAVLEADLGADIDRIAAAGLFDPDLAVQVRAGLGALRPELDAIPATPFLHDTTTKNVIVAEGGVLAGVVDVDSLCYGDPRLTPALTLASLTATGGPGGYVESWMAQAGQPMDRLFRFYVARCLVSFMAEHGRDLNGNQPADDAEARERLQRTFADAWRRFDAA